MIPKITSANLCKPIHDIINYSTSICPFESGKCGKEGKKLQKFEHLENEKSFFEETKKKHFLKFLLSPVLEEMLLFLRNKQAYKNKKEKTKENTTATFQ